MEMEMKPIPEYENEYAIGDDCTVYRLLNRRNNSNKPYAIPKPITARKDIKGYWVVSLCKHGKVSTRKVSRLMLMAFVGLPPSKYHQAAHLDGNKDNNTIDNLKWVLIEENEAHKKLHGTVAKGERNGAAKLTDEQVSEIRKRAASGESRRVLATEFNTSRGNIQSIVNGKSRVDTEVFYKKLYLEAAAREAVLREALEDCRDFFDPEVGSSHLSRKLTIKDINNALSQPTDDSALEAIVQRAGEVMRERCLSEIDPKYYSHDLAEHIVEGCCDDIRALPGVTLDDLKGN